MKHVSGNLHLERRNGIYYYRRRVPDSAVQAVGAKTIKYSLKTHSKQQALKLREVEDIKWSARFAAAQTAKPGGVALTEVQAVEAVRVYIQRAFDAFDKDYRRDPPADSAERQDIRIQNEIDLASLRSIGDPNAEAWVDGIAKKLRSGLGDHAGGDAASELAFAEIVRRGLLELSRRKLARIDDDYSRQEFDELFAARAPRLTFRALCEEYRARVSEEAEINGISKKRTDKVAANLALIEEIVGPETPVHTIDFDACQQVRTLLARIPANRNKFYSKLSLDEAIEKAAAEGKATLSSTTQGQYLETLKNVLALATLKRAIPHNPAQSIRPLKREALSLSQRRQPFSLDQIQGFFSSAFYRSCAPDAPVPYSKADRPWRFWLPLLCLFLGLRPNEACQLLVTDIKQTKAGTWFVDIVSTADDDDSALGGKRLKTTASRRKVPLHPEILRLGFLDFVAEREAAKNSPRLFHTLKPDTYGNLATYALKRFRDSFLPAAIELGERQSFYSFRHSFRDALRRIDAQPATLQALGGWSQGSLVSDHYGDSTDPDYQAPWIARVVYPGLDLAFLSTSA